MDVSLLNWPDDKSRRELLREARHPRLLLVTDEAPAPATEDCLEDWVRVPASDEDLRARLAALMQRAREHHADLPVVQDDGTVRFADRTAHLPPLDQRLFVVLATRYGVVVSRDDLMSAGWPGRQPVRNVLDVHLVRLRRHLREIGLTIRTVRARGYVLEAIAFHEVADRDSWTD